MYLIKLATMFLGGRHTLEYVTHRAKAKTGTLEETEDSREEEVTQWRQTGYLFPQHYNKESNQSVCA